MAFTDYYELSVMLRLQLPILLSFAVLRCLMGIGTKFWALKITPQRLQDRMQPVWVAYANLLSCMHGALLIALAFYFLWNYERWPTNMCGEYVVPRVQGIACAVGLLGLMTSSDPLAHSMALALLKCVADGSLAILFLAPLVWRAQAETHYWAPKRFYGILFPLSVGYTQYCYTDEKGANRTAGPSIAMSLASLFLLYQLFFLSARKSWRAWVRLRRAMWTRVASLVVPQQYGPAPLPMPVTMEVVKED